LTETDPAKAVQMHKELNEVNAEMAAAEERWLELNPF